jgi:hypothetical protein
MAPDDQHEQLLDRTLAAQPVWQPPGLFAQRVGRLGTSAVLEYQQAPPRLTLVDWTHAAIEGMSAAAVATGTGYVLWLGIPQLHVALRTDPQTIAWTCALLLALPLLCRTLPDTI